MFRLVSRAVLVASVLLVTSGTALGVVRTATVSDPLDVGRSIDGYARPDIKSFTLTYDSELGTLKADVGFHAAVPKSQNGRAAWMQLYFSVGSVSPEGYCDAWSHEGDTSWNLEVLRYANSDAVTLTASLAQINGQLTVPNAGSFSADGKTLSVSVSSAEFVRRAYTCVTNVSEYFPGLSGSDEVAGFFFPGFAPPPPPQDNVKPTIAWTNPLDGQTISGVYSENAPNTSFCHMTANDNVGVNHVDIYIDGQLDQTQVNFPWACEIDTRDLSEGPHTLRAVAVDAAGNTGSQTIGVTVKNVNAPPTPDPPAPPAPPAPNPPAPVIPVPVVQVVTAGPQVPVVAPLPALTVTLNTGRTALRGTRLGLVARLSRTTTSPVLLQQKLDGRFVTIARTTPSGKRVVFTVPLRTLGGKTFRIRCAEAGSVALSSSAKVNVVARLPR